MSADNTLSSNCTTDLELSSTNQHKATSTNISDSTQSTLTVIDESDIVNPYKVNTVICCAIIFMILGKILIPILISLTFAFQFEMIDKWSVDSIEVVECYNNNNKDIKTACHCDGHSFVNDSFCEINIEGSYVEVSIALNTMVLIVESLWFIGMLFGLKRHSLCNKLGFFKAIGQILYNYQCCLFVWRIFELTWYIAIVFQWTKLHCECIDGNDIFHWTKQGLFYKMSYYLDLTAIGCISLYLVSKTIFYYLMAKMTKTGGGYYDMGAFFAVLKVYYIDGKSFGREDSVSVWSPLKQRQDDIKYQAQNLKLHYKGWK